MSLAALASGCVYRINIQQGNFLDQAAVDQVKPGMTRSQVRYLLGTPMVADSFNKERWDYIYYLKKGRTGHVDSRRVTVYFDGDKVARWTSRATRSPRSRTPRPPKSRTAELTRRAEHGPRRALHGGPPRASRARRARLRRAFSDRPQGR
jgi:outer membrane protein assembly factor BamE